MYTRSFLREEAKIKQHTSSKKKLFKSGEKAIWESWFARFLFFIILKSLDFVFSYEDFTRINCILYCKKIIVTLKQSWRIHFSKSFSASFTIGLNFFNENSFEFTIFYINVKLNEFPGFFKLSNLLHLNETDTGSCTVGPWLHLGVCT